MIELFPVPPELLMGEAGICGYLAMVAIAQLYQENQHMNGWQDTVNDQARLAARTWWLFPDLTGGAKYVFSVDDLKKQMVQQIIKGTGPPKAVYPCAVGELAFY